MRREKIAERQRFADDLARRDALRGTAPLKPRKRYPPSRLRRMRLSRPGEIRALARLLSEQPEAPGFWRQFGRSFTLVETADIEIIEPRIFLDEAGGNIYLDEDTARRVYALAWERFEEALVKANALYNEQPTEQKYHFNRVKRLLWEVNDLQRHIEFIFGMTYLPDDLIDEDDAADA